MRNPNLQNLPNPVRDPWQIRRAWIAPRIRRMLIVQYLEERQEFGAKGTTREQLAQRFRVSVDTVQLDLARLRREGERIELCCPSGRGGVALR